MDADFDGALVVVGSAAGLAIGAIFLVTTGSLWAAGGAWVASTVIGVWLAGW